MSAEAPASYYGWEKPYKYLYSFKSNSMDKTELDTMF